MKVLHLAGGGDVGGAKTHILSLVKELGNYIEVGLVSLRPGVFADEARSMGINVEIINTGNIIKDFNILTKLVRDKGYNILHSHGAKANLFAVVARKRTKVPAVTTIHSDYRLDYLASIPKMLSFGMINIAALRFIDYYIGVSDNYREMLIKRNFKPDRIFTVYNGINFDIATKAYDRNSFSAKYDLNLNGSEVLVGILARLDPVKGLGTFLKAAGYVLGQNKNVVFIIGGDGKERKALENTAKTLGIENNVRFLGWVSDTFEFMANIDINVLTSLSESFPYVILEGVRFKKATVSSEVGGISDLIESGENGFLFKVGDYESLGEHILRLSEDGRLREAMGKKIYKKASERFSLARMCKTQLDIYTKITHAKSGEHAAQVKKHEYTHDVIISGWYGFRNIGDDAILKAVIEDLKLYKKGIKLVVLSWNPSEIRKTYGVDSINRFNIFKIISTMMKAKLFIYGGGTLIQESTSTRSLLYYLITIWAAKKIGLKVMLYANGIEQIKRYINRKLTQRILNEVEIITLREELSVKELQNLSVVKPRILVTADAALTIIPAGKKEAARLLAKEGISQGGLKIGFSVRMWEGYRKYENVIAQAADYVIERYGAKPVFIPMQYPNDLYISENIISKMSGKGYVIRNIYSESQVMGIINEMQLLVGMRLHSLIFAASLGIPVIGLVYTAKVEAFLQYIGLSRASAGYIKHLEPGRLNSLIDDIWVEREAVTSHLKKTLVPLKEKARENARIAVELINDRFY